MSFFDFANLKRQIIFYMYDLEHYKNESNGFYIDLEELPGKIVQTQEELEEVIKKVKNLNLMTNTKNLIINTII